MKSTINVVAQVTEEEVEGMSRYTFMLNSLEGVRREFIIDVPHDDNNRTDVWVLGHHVQVGDTPSDGFATYTRAPEVPVDRIKTHHFNDDCNPPHVDPSAT